MSTNYYFIPDMSNPLSVYGEIHIGKQSGGWVFSFQGYDYKGGVVSAEVDRYAGLSVQVETTRLVIKDAATWFEVLEYGTIKDEYGTHYSVAEFAKDCICSKEDTFNGRKLRVHAKEYGDDPDRNWVDAEGYSFSGYEFS